MTDVHEELRRAVRVGVSAAEVDAILARCPDPECGDCGRIICPVGDRFHFHHDGCPSEADTGLPEDFEE